MRLAAKGRSAVPRTRSEAAASAMAPPRFASIMSAARLARSLDEGPTGRRGFVDGVDQQQALQIIEFLHRRWREPSDRDGVRVGGTGRLRQEALAPQLRDE